MVLALAESKRLSVGQQRGRLRARVTEVKRGLPARVSVWSLLKIQVGDKVIKYCV